MSLGEPILRRDDVVNTCPQCSSRHGISVGLIRTDVRRKGVLVSIKTGNKMECQKCGLIYASTDEGTFRYATQPQYQHRTALPEETLPPDGPAPVVRMTPRERPRV